MANTAQAKKRAKQAEKSRIRNAGHIFEVLMLVVLS
jgi:ribosomal protein S20